MRVLVFGGRDYADVPTLVRVLDELHAQHSFSCVVEGEARGADRMAARWASLRCVPIDPYPADWDRLGLAAGPVRNARMLAQGKPELAVGFPGGDGSADMAAKVLAAGIKLIAVDRSGRTWTVDKSQTGSGLWKSSKKSSGRSSQEHLASQPKMI